MAETVANGTGERGSSRIQARNREAILAAAEALFSTYGFRGATLDQIAARAGMSKPNLLYYFKSKETLYVACLEAILDEWLAPLRAIDAAGDPLDEISRYIEAKVRMACNRPEASRLFATEIIQGAPRIGSFLSGELKALVDEKAAVVEQWIGDGRLAPVDPRHLIMMIWAVTQHYADFDAQVRAVLGRPTNTGVRSNEPEETCAAILRLFREGLRPR